MELNVKDIQQWMEQTNQRIQKNKEYLTSLDQAIGDGDHGINMARGFREVINKTSVNDYATVSDVLKEVAMTLMGKVGGASGPLYGTAFLKMSTATKDKEVDDGVFSDALDQAVQGIVLRGKAKPGDKTMLDVWTPVLELVKENSSVNPDALVETAKGAMEATKDTVAIKGRAAYLGERSKGHIDPGSASSYFLFEALVEVLKGGN